MLDINREILRDYLNDSLPDAELAAVEKAIRERPEVAKLLEQIRGDADRRDHSVGSVWRQTHVSCPSRDQLGSYLLQALDNDLYDYIEFHLGTVGCAYCQANLDDLRRLHAEANTPKTTTRRKKIVKSSAGVLRDVTRPT